MARRLIRRSRAALGAEFSIEYESGCPPEGLTHSRVDFSIICINEGEAL